MAKSVSKIILAAAVGLAAGIGVGMLIAPAKGKKTRKRLRKRILGIADILQDDISEKLNAFKSALSPEEEEEDVADTNITTEKEDK